MKTARVSTAIERLAYRPADAATCIGVSRAQLYEYIRSKQIRARKMGGATLVLRVDLENFLASLPEVDPDREATS